ncbi:hypothetical protein [Corynebacterium sp.]|uniref:hypothetical protein n=1 Tax=Corynebacterium sp. TaxID=1720 RepID=UPI0026DC5A72|nr:hypothetical protein [Corynebacterium sp.]MDO5076115.1 hypothetical protein [Corynebacterium sp.]
MRSTLVIAASVMFIGACSAHLQASPASTTTTPATPVTVAWHGDQFLTRFGHHCTLRDAHIECQQEKHQVTLTPNGVRHEQRRRPATAERQALPAILPVGARIEDEGAQCTVSEKALECSIRGKGKTQTFRGNGVRMDTADGELYTIDPAVEPRGGTPTEFGGMRGHKFAMRDPDGGQLACFIPSNQRLTEDPTFIICGAKTKDALSGQFRIGTELTDLGTARPQVPFADNPQPGPVSIARDDVQCAGESAALICQTPLGEFQITTHQAGFDNIHPLNETSKQR